MPLPLSHVPLNSLRVGNEVFFLRSLPSGEPVQSRTQRNGANRLLGWIQGDVEKVTQRSPRLMPGHRIPFLF